MKLELKHLAGYLPYELKCKAQGEGNKVFDMQGFTNLTDVDLHELDRIVCEQFDMEDVFPILRPLSDLTKEIEVNGEKFVPIEILLDIESGEKWSCSDYLISESGQNEWWVRLKENKSFIFGYSNRGFYMLNQFSEAKTVNNQVELWQKLLEWHFDIYGLIEKGLAIDVNTL